VLTPGASTAERLGRSSKPSRITRDDREIFRPIPRLYTVPVSYHDPGVLAALLRDAGSRRGVRARREEGESPSAPSRHRARRRHPVYGEIMQRRPEALAEIEAAVATNLARELGDRRCAHAARALGRGGALVRYKSRAISRPLERASACCRDVAFSGTTTAVLTGILVRARARPSPTREISISVEQLRPLLRTRSWPSSGHASPKDTGIKIKMDHRGAQRPPSTPPRCRAGGHDLVEMRMHVPPPLAVTSSRRRTSPTS